MDNQKIGNLIKKRRKELELTQQQLADMLGVSFKSVSKWECGNSIPDISILKKVSDVLNITIEDLLEGKDHNEVIKSKKKNNYIYIILLVLIIVLLFLLFNNKNNYKEELEYECVLTKTYHIKNINKSNDENYLYVTLSEFQGVGTFTIKLEKSLSNELNTDKNYEFTFNTYENLLNETPETIFANSQLINIKISEKVGLEQTNEYNCK